MKELLGNVKTKEKLTFMNIDSDVCTNSEAIANGFNSFFATFEN